MKPFKYLRKMRTQEKQLIDEIKHKTRQQNLNNLTRTEAYLHFYRKHPEIEWAFLAHMVSRNAGWNMTDLKGELLPRLLTAEEQNTFFAFLERGNWLIFQDAYPQLLIYEESKKRGKALFDLLTELAVSKYMEHAWHKFWLKQNKKELTVNLIINEQHYIEDKLIQTSHFKKALLNTFEFKIQEFLKMNHILFPCQQDGKTQLLGKTVHHFTSLEERIAVGKALYEIIINNDGVKQWAIKQKHTGSRKDYWPHFYTDILENSPSFPFAVKSIGCHLLNEHKRFYSPKLENVWENTVNQEPSDKDWFSTFKTTKKYFTMESPPSSKPILESYCKTLDLLQAAALAKKMFLPWRPQDISSSIEGFTAN